MSALFQSVQKLPGSSLPGDGSELPICKCDQQTEWQCQGAPARSSMCRVSCGIQWTLTDLELASVKEQIAHTPLRISTIVC